MPCDFLQRSPTIFTYRQVKPCVRCVVGRLSVCFSSVTHVLWLNGRPTSQKIGNSIVEYADAFLLTAAITYTCAELPCRIPSLIVAFDTAASPQRVYIGLGNRFLSATRSQTIGLQSAHSSDSWTYCFA